MLRFDAFRSTALAVVAVALVACGGLPNVLPTPVPPDALRPNAPPPAVAPPAVVPPDPAKVGELQRNRATWEALRIADYTMTLIFGCECALGGRSVTVTIRDGRVVAAKDEEGALPLDRLLGFPATIDGLFDYAEQNANAGKLEFKWDPQIGIPVAVAIDPDVNTIDDEIRIAILDFKPGP
jgi:Family of unknown function (DUF6174)